MNGKQEEAWICVAAVATAHGVRGALKLRCFTENPEDVAAYGPLFDRTGKPLFEISIVGSAKGGVIAKASGVDDRDAAEALRGMELFVPRSSLPEPDDDEFYYEDLQGMVAVDVASKRIGVVRQVVNYGAGDLLEIERDAGGIQILPFDRETVPVIDLSGRQVTVRPPSEVVAEAEA